MDSLNVMEPGSTIDKLDYPSLLGSFGRGSGSFASLMA